MVKTKIDMVKTKIHMEKKKKLTIGGGDGGQGEMVWGKSKQGQGDPPNDLTRVGDGEEGLLVTGCNMCRMDK